MISLYDLSVVNYLRVINATIATLKKGEQHFLESGQDLDEIVNCSLTTDMLPFSFQVDSVCHHTIDSANSLLDGKAGPPDSLPELDYAGLIKLLEDAAEELKGISADDINAKMGEPVIFKMGKLELPFTAENFVQSFSMPNLYFHAATAYDLLRLKGVPLGKADFLGHMQLNFPK